MPPVVIGATIAGTIAVIIGGGGIAAFATVFFTTLILGAISLALQPDLDFGEGSIDRNINVIQPITYRAVVYGETRVSGPIIFLDTTDDNSRLHFIVPLAGHEVEEIGNIFFDGDHVPLDGSGNATGKFAGLVRIKKHLGTSSQAADPDLVAESTFWTTAHQGLDVAYLYVRLVFNEKKFTRIPDVTAIVKGAKLFDTRDSGTRWSRNSALIRRDYLTNSYYGMGVPASFLDDSSITEAANIDDELIDVQEASDDFTVDAGTDIFTRSTLNALWLTGDVVQLTTTDTLPSPLALATDYFIIIEQFKAVDGETTTTFKLAASLADALSRTPINITDAGTGTHTVTRMQEVRYTIDGSFGMNLPHEEVLNRMNTASYGKLIYSSGTWFIHSGAFRSPTAPVITEDDLRGPIQLQTLLAKSELANGVTGIYINPYDDWQPKEFPSVISSTFVTEDGETINKDIRLPFTVSTGTAQRIAKIELLRTRQQQTVILPCKLTVLDTRAGDTVQFTYDRFGFSSKEFEIIDWEFSFNGGEENLALGIDIVGREVASTDYDFLTSEEQTIDPAPNTNLPNPFVVIDPTGLTLLSGTAQLYLRLDGTVMSRIRAEWTAPADAFVTDNGQIEIQFKRSADSEWQKAPNVRGDEVFTFLLDVEDGVAYDVRIQSVNHLRVKNDTWVTETNHTVVGKTTVPSDVSTFSAQQNGNVVTFSWSEVTDPDLSGYILKFSDRGSFIWEEATFITKTTKGTLVTNASLPPGDWTLGIKAIDTSKNSSTNEATFDLVVTNTNDIILSVEEHPRWLNLGSGTGEGFIRHDVSGRLVPDSTVLASGAGFEIFDVFVFGFVDTSIYEGAVHDLGFDAKGVRAWLKTVEGLGPGEIDELVGVTEEFDYRLDAEAFDGFDVWTVGVVDLRFGKFRIVFDHTLLGTGVGYLEEFIPTFDIEERTERDENVVIAVAGTTITFSEEFHSIPNIQTTVSAGSGLFAIVSSVTTTSFVATVFNSSGIDVGGNINWLATGA